MAPRPGGPRQARSRRAPWDSYADWRNGDERMAGRNRTAVSGDDFLIFDSCASKRLSNAPTRVEPRPIVVSVANEKSEEPPDPAPKVTPWTVGERTEQTALSALPSSCDRRARSGSAGARRLCHLSPGVLSGCRPDRDRRAGGADLQGEEGSPTGQRRLTAEELAPPCSVPVAARVVVWIGAGSTRPTRGAKTALKRLMVLGLPKMGNRV
jgi:hypothetical protein